MTPLTDQQRALRFYRAKQKLMLTVALVVAVGALVTAGIMWSLSIRVPHGTPSGNSVRAANEIATLIQTLEAYVPSLHRDPSRDRYRLSLFLYPVDGRSPGRSIALERHLGAQEAAWAKLLGGDGRTVWFDVKGLGGVRTATGERIGPAELRAANPGLAETWDDPRRISFAQRLRVTLPDRTVLAVDPETLKAAPAVEVRAPVLRVSGPVVQDFLCSGVRPAPDEWLGLHSPGEAERDFRPGSRLGGADDAVDAKEPRRFHRGELGPELDRGRREIVSMTPLSSDEYLNAAFVRSGPDAEPLRLDGPDGFLMVFTSAPGLAGTLVVARVDADARLAWQVDTGIDRFQWSQVLPATDHVAFVGTRLALPGKVPEPILVVLDVQAGTLVTSSLWQ